MATGLDPLEPTDLDHRLRAAEAVVREAGRLAADHFARRELLSIDRKGAQDLVSEADRACEDLVGARLSGLFPGDGFLGEERGSRNPGATAVWVIDPIDGTHNFLTGIPFWCVSVGLVTSGELGEIAFATAMRFAADSLLEESGFEPVVPATWPTRSRPSLSPGSHSHSCLRDQLVHREGPTVRIRFPPAASLSHWCLPCLRAQRPGFPRGCEPERDQRPGPLAASRLALAAFL